MILLHAKSTNYPLLDFFDRLVSEFLRLIKIKMGDIISLKKAGSQSDNLITSHPFEFRKAEWKSIHFIQMLRSQSEKLENPCHGKSYNHTHLPMHFVLKNGNACTIQNLYYYRHSEDKMKEVYYLSGLIDCVINRVCPLLRTEMVNDIYRKIITLKKLFNVNWYGHMDQVLLPLDLHLYNTNSYNNRLPQVKTMKELYDFIRLGTDEMFKILKMDYVFYTPGSGV